MEYIILVICIVTILIVKFALGINAKDMKKVKEIGYDKSLNELTNQLPENESVCKAILVQLKNTNVNIKESEDKNNKLTYYSVMSNSIIIANIKDTFTRVQTIAHECIHSIQNRRMLRFNFIFSNIYLLYFIVILALTIMKVIKMPHVFMIILILLGLIYYTIRSYLETDAMTKAPYVAKQYMEESKQISEQEIETIMEQYTILNKIGIPMTNFGLIVSVMIKIMIYCVAIIIIGG